MLSALEAIELSICSIFKIAIRELRLGKEIVMNAVCSLGKGILGEFIFLIIVIYFRNYFHIF